MQYEMMISESSHTERGPNMTTRGVIAEDGFEWVEWPELSGVWYWRDPETNQWFLHE
jgi:hypothetical protein